MFGNSFTIFDAQNIFILSLVSSSYLIVAHHTPDCDGDGILNLLLGRVAQTAAALLVDRDLFVTNFTACSATNFLCLLVSLTLDTDYVSVDILSSSTSVDDVSSSFGMRWSEDRFDFCTLFVG